MANETGAVKTIHIVTSEILYSKSAVEIVLI